jgi:hypothetical protein
MEEFQTLFLCSAANVNCDKKSRDRNVGQIGVGVDVCIGSGESGMWPCFLLFNKGWGLAIVISELFHAVRLRFSEAD